MDKCFDHIVEKIIIVKEGNLLVMEGQIWGVGVLKGLTPKGPRHISNRNCEKIAIF